MPAAETDEQMAAFINVQNLVDAIDRALVQERAEESASQEATPARSG
jgi:hypothetical protein